ncbi:hypothetical protein O181_099092 [Austropuccinia psidii MF-1]|uniref:Uncharacterized protein n=1 Tax=Austropuccinia psidii MF-1 TaxID=1389203 RepID=A0A9Q3JBN4_9BASI|nr:hypothetical protein [Austropuccinia psidii MF-1]
MELLGPFWLKGAKGQFIRSQTTGGPTRASFGPKSQPTQNVQNHLRTKIGQGSPVGHCSAHGLWQPPEATSSAPIKDYPQVQGKMFPSSMHLVLKDPGVVCIWYNIPLCTIFPQKSNVDILRTKSCDSKSSPQSITNLKENFSAIQSGTSLAATRRPFKDPNPLALQGLGCQFSSGLF